MCLNYEDDPVIPMSCCSHTSFMFHLFFYTHISLPKHSSFWLSLLLTCEGGDDPHPSHHEARSVTLTLRRGWSCDLTGISRASHAHALGGNPRHEGEGWNPKFDGH